MPADANRPSLLRLKTVATTDLRLEKQGSLPRPGPIGRTVRIVFGAFCLWYVVGLLDTGITLTSTDGTVPALLWNGVIPGLFLVSYVVNIGFSRNWRKWPAYFSGVILLAAAAIGYGLDGTIESALLARTIWIWELYIFLHLGLAFVVAGMIGTPGCEMRAFHDLYSRFTGIETAEHHCPIGPLQPIDRWESRWLETRR